MAQDDADVWCDGDLRPDMPDISGRSLILQDLRNRLETAPGTLAWDPQGGDYGYDVRALLNTKQHDFGIPSALIAAECEKDERVNSATCSVRWTGENAIQIDVVLVDNAGPFPMTLAVTPDSVELLLNGP